MLIQYLESPFELYSLKNKMLMTTLIAKKAAKTIHIIIS